MNQVGYFEIQSSDPEREIRFYHTVFGWEFLRDAEVHIPYYRIERAGIRGALLQRPAPVPQGAAGTNAFVCSVQVINFDKAAETILEAGGQVALPKFAIPGRCWQGYFTDTDQNTFGIFQADENAK